MGPSEVERERLSFDSLLDLEALEDLSRWDQTYTDIGSSRFGRCETCDAAKKTQKDYIYANPKRERERECINQRPYILCVYSVLEMFDAWYLSQAKP